VFVSISHCINKELSLSIEDYTQVDGVDIGIQSAKKKVSLAVIIVLVISAVIIFNIEFNKDFFLDLFIHDVVAQSIISESLYVFYVSLVLSGLQVVLLGIVKTLQVTILWKLSLFSYYIFGIGSTILIGYFLELGVRGIWIGWSIGSTISLLFLIKYISQIEWQ
jgi:MATE family multidrug resistance protein